jgi:hypothetical protein
MGWPSRHERVRFEGAQMEWKKSFGGSLSFGFRSDTPTHRWTQVPFLFLLALVVASSSREQVGDFAGSDRGMGGLHYDIFVV